MIELTVGYVSGIIAAAIFVVRFFIPHAITLILVGILKDDNSAVTWSVVGRTIHNSYWPMILRTDSSASFGVRKSVKVISMLKQFSLGLVAVAAIVTPLGLYEAILAGEEATPWPFQYVKDSSPMGYGTPPRSDLGFSRKCGPMTCPGSDVTVITSINDTTTSADLPNGYDTRIPRNLTELFSSGLAAQSPSMSSIFDIQWRSYTTDQSDNIDKGAKFLVGAFRQLSTLILDDTVQAVEGLVVDTLNGGIGFRNHTVPLGLQYGATWSEELLFAEPETQCVDTNLTLDFSIPTGLFTDNIANLTLTDRGGFSLLIQKYPEYDLSDTQQNPDLLGRAYKAAWMNNALTMAFLNVTNPAPHAFSYLNSTVGKQFPLSTSPSRVSFDSLLSVPDWGSYLNLQSPFGSNDTSSNFSYSSRQNFSQPNPFHISSNNFSDISTLCQGAGGEDLANITNIAVGCGMLFGAARREDGKPSLIFEPGSKWTVPLYSCAAATKVLIKNVQFQYNGTEGLKGLSVLSVQDKQYSASSVKPLWGVEDTGMALSDTHPLWGLIGPQFKNQQNLSTVQQEVLWLPGYSMSSIGSPSSGYQNLPGVDFHTDALSSAFDIGSGSSSTGTQDYSGKSNLAMYAKWQELSRAPSTAARIINLVWTDIAANAVTGTKSWFPSPALPDLAKRDSGAPQQAVNVPVTVYSRRIKYKYLFAIPAVIVVFITLLTALGALILLVVGRARPAAMRKFLFKTSAGRILSTFVYPDECDPQTATKVWIHRVGSKRVDLSGDVPRASDPAMFASRPSTYAAEDPLLGKERTNVMVSERLPPPNGYGPPSPYNNSVVHAR